MLSLSGLAHCVACVACRRIAKKQGLRKKTYILKVVRILSVKVLGHLGSDRHGGQSLSFSNCCGGDLGCGGVVGDDDDDDDDGDGDG